MLESARVKCLPNALGSALSTVTHDLHRPSRENHLNLTAKESSPHYEMRDSTQILGDCRLHCRRFLLAPTTLHPLLALLRSGCRKAWIPRHWRSTWTCATRRHWRPRRNTSHKWMIDLKSMSATIANVYMYMCTYILKRSWQHMSMYFNNAQDDSKFAAIL